MRIKKKKASRNSELTGRNAQTDNKAKEQGHVGEKDKHVILSQINKIRIFFSIRGRSG